MTDSSIDATDEDVSILKGKIKDFLNDSVSYLLETNGYVCLGKKYNGLTFIWGQHDIPSERLDSSQSNQYYPIQLDEVYTGVLSELIGHGVINVGSTLGSMIVELKTNYVYIRNDWDDEEAGNGATSTKLHRWIIIGRINLA